MPIHTPEERAKNKARRERRVAGVKKFVAPAASAIKAAAPALQAGRRRAEAAGVVPPRPGRVQTQPFGKPGAKPKRK